MDSQRSCLLQQENNLLIQQSKTVNKDNQDELQLQKLHVLLGRQQTQQIENSDQYQQNNNLHENGNQNHRITNGSSQQLHSKSIPYINAKRERIKSQIESDESEEGFEDAQNANEQSESELDELEKLKGEITFSIPNVEAKSFRKQRDQLPPPPILDQQQFSLIPDMISGWRPKFGKEQLPPPIPLCFEDDNLDYIIDKLQKTQRYTILYLGYRPKTSYDFHRDYSGKNNGYTFKYGNILLQKDVLSQFNVHIESEGVRNNHMLSSQDGSMHRRAFIGMNPQYPPNLMHFDSKFEGGNIDCVVKISNLEYDLYMRVDTNTKGHLQWYNFKVTNTKKGDRVKFNIQNFTKKRSLYQRGLRPFVKSGLAFQQKQTDWLQAGYNITYQQRRALKYDYKVSKQ